MLPEKILQSDLLDILFENRNKNYGAYALRKFYNTRMNIALSATVFLSSIILVIIMMHHNKQPEYVKSFIIPPDSELLSFKNDELKPPQTHIQHATNFRQVNTSTPVISHDPDINSTQPTIADIDNSIISDVSSDGDAPVDINALPGANSGNSESLPKPVPVIEYDAPLIIAQVMPEYPGGINALIKFMLRNLHQPDDLQQGEKIKVIASFVVSKTGGIENLKIISSGRTDLDKEVLRVINKMPLWKPGMQNNKAVSVYFNLPVTFQSAE